MVKYSKKIAYVPTIFLIKFRCVQGCVFFFMCLGFRFKPEATTRLHYKRAPFWFTHKNKKLLVAHTQTRTPNLSHQRNKNSGLKPNHLARWLRFRSRENPQLWRGFFRSSGQVVLPPRNSRKRPCMVGTMIAAWGT